MSLHTYLPQDRLLAIVNDTTLPDRISGSALFADISGFTALTESLRESLGARQGAEELTRQLGEVYTALIAEIEKHDGSVIGFAGDSMLCWFESNDESAVLAISAAFGMQNRIKAFPDMALKVSIASGDARRFVVGDETIQRIDVLAGATVARTATGEHLAIKGDVLVIATHEVTYESLPFATRARLHEQLARYLESIVGAIRESPLLDIITFRYLRSENNDKQIEYLRKAGEAAQKNFANDAALEYYRQLLPLLTDDQEKHQIHLKRGEVLELIGKWDDAESDYRAALEFAKDELALKSSAQYALGKLNRQRGDFEPAQEWLGQAKEARTKLEDKAGLALQEGNTVFSAQILGAVESALKGLNAVVEPDYTNLHEQTLAKVKEALGEAEFQSAWEEGSQWSLEEAVKKVLDE